MPYTIPAASDLIARYPAFAAVDTTFIDAVIAEAAGQVSTTWIEADYQPAILALAAHKMTVEGFGTNVDAQLAGFKRLKVGPLELERAVSSAVAGEYGSTIYGVAFQGYLRRNFPGVAVAKAGEDQT